MNRPHTKLLLSLAKTVRPLALLLAGAPALLAQFPHSSVDPALRSRGAALYADKCASCHGDDARGTATGPDLLRSLPVLHDRREMLYGKELAPLLTTLPGHSYKFSDKQMADLSQFLTGQINGILRSGYNAEPTHLLDGDAHAGEAYFRGAGGCTQCHSTTGDLAGIGSRYAPATLQQKFLFPNSGLFLKKKVQATVQLASGKRYTGDLVAIDDFTVTLRPKAGSPTLSFNRVPGVTVTTDAPYKQHIQLLHQYTDADVHNLTTYLNTLK